ncbi:MAG: hypothetical protein Q7R56_03550 [Nanoarchaeota archaeon]|nr:hypothetical protein [Nanoarchaeota archaeon]
MQKRYLLTGIIILLFLLPFVLAEETTNDQTITEKAANFFTTNIRIFEFIIFFLIFLFVLKGPLAGHFGDTHKPLAVVLALVFAAGLLAIETKIMGEGKTYFELFGAAAGILIIVITIVLLYIVIKHLSGANMATLAITTGILLLLELAIVNDWFELYTNTISNMSFIDDPSQIVDIISNYLIVPTLFVFIISLILSIFKRKKGQQVYVVGGKP